jgi:hypothetical protein
MGILGAILIAIFVVEKYLERRRSEDERRSALEKEKYRAQWELYIHGGVSILSALITHLSLFVAYGKSRYLQLLNVHEDTRHVPETIRAFTPWLVDSMYEGRKERRTASSELYGGMGKDIATHLAEVFEKETLSKSAFIQEDLVVLLHYLRLFDQHLRDQAFLFQPFMVEHMGVSVGLVRFSHSLHDSISNIERRIAIGAQIEGGISASNVDDKIRFGFCTLGRQAVAVMEMIWAGPDDIEQVLKEHQRKNESN